MWDSAPHVALFIVAMFIAVTAIPGGIALLVGWEKKRYPLEFIRHTPFKSYNVPGTLLTVAVGGSALAAALTTVYSPDAFMPVSVIAGAIMMGWIIGEIIILKQPLTWGTLWEVGYFLGGLAMVILAQVAWRG